MIVGDSDYKMLRRHRNDVFRMLRKIVQNILPNPFRFSIDKAFNYNLLQSYYNLL